jgi:hypothetical protein
MHHRSLRYWIAGFAVAVALPAGVALAQVPQLPPVPTAVPVPVPTAVPVPVPTAVPVPKVPVPVPDVPKLPTPSVPDVPKVPVPSVPKIPKPSVPKLPAPDLPNLPAPVGRGGSGSGSSGGGSAPATNGGRSSGGATNGGATNGGGGSSGGGGATSAAGGSGAPAGESGQAGSAAAPNSGPARAAKRRARRARARTAAAPTPRERRVRRERRLRRAVVQLAGCLGEVAAGERRVLVLRAGAGDRRPLSRQTVAERLDTNVRTVARTERRGVRHLRAAARGGACGGLEPGAGTAIAGDGGEAGADGSAVLVHADPIPARGSDGEGERIGTARSGVKDSFATGPAAPGPATLFGPGASADGGRGMAIPLLLLAAFVTGFAIMWTVQGRRGGGARTA